MLYEGSSVKLECGRGGREKEEGEERGRRKKGTVRRGWDSRRTPQTSKIYSVQIFREGSEILKSRYIFFYRTVGRETFTDMTFSLFLQFTSDSENIVYIITITLR